MDGSKADLPRDTYVLLHHDILSLHLDGKKVLTVLQVLDHLADLGIVSIFSWPLAGNLFFESADLAGKHDFDGGKLPVWQHPTSLMPPRIPLAHRGPSSPPAPG